MFFILFFWIQDPVPPISATKVYLVTGKIIDCQSYEIKGKNLVIVDLEGKMFQIPLKLVNMDATENPPPSVSDPESNETSLTWEPPPSEKPPQQDLFTVAKDSWAASIEKLEPFKKEVFQIGLTQEAWEEEMWAFNPLRAEAWKARVMQRAQVQAKEHISDEQWPAYLEEQRMKKQFEARLAKQKEEIEAEDKRIAQAEAEEKEFAIKRERWALESKREKEKEEQMNRQGFFKVTYQIYLCGKGSITYHQNGSSMQKDIRSHERITFWARQGEFVYISAQNGECEGNVTVSIYVGDTLAKEATSNGPFKIAATSGRL